VKESFFRIHFVETVMILLEHLVWNRLGSDPWTSGLIASGHLYISLLNQISAPNYFFFFFWVGGNASEVFAVFYI